MHDGDTEVRGAVADAKLGAGIDQCRVYRAGFGAEARRVYLSRRQRMVGEDAKRVALDEFIERVGAQPP